MSELTPVQEFYKDKTIFITGASGFMGKVLIEKLLYSCSDVKEIIILMRPKRGKAPETRLEEMFKLPMFQRVRDEKPHVTKKVTLVQGDVTIDSLGLSGATLQHIIDNTSIVFHLAATLKLEGNLKDAINMNTTGTKRTLDISKLMPKLEAFIHLSTGFCNCDHEIMYEKVYDYPHRPEDLMRMIEWMDNSQLDAMTPELLKPHPNTYTYSKRLAEILVRDHYPQMPVVITRPSIVSPSAYEPVPGWVDNLNGPTGLMVGAGKGVIRSMLIDQRNRSEVIPVDYAINGLITIAYEFCTQKKPDTVPVYNVTAAEHRKQNWGEVIELSKKIGYQYPMSVGLWYPDGCITTNKYLHQFNVIFFHWLPAYVIDFILLILGKERFMLRVQNRVSIGLGVLQFFSMRAWVFRSENFENVWNKLTSEDKKIFNMDMNPKETNAEYMESCVIGGRQYLLNESPDSLPQARKLLKIPDTVPVYNITAAEHRKQNWGDIIVKGKEIGYQYPMSVGLWYPDGCITTNKYLHQFNVIFLHWLPAYIIDFVLLILGKKRFMLRVQNRVSIGLSVLQFFSMRAWVFRSEKYENVWNQLTPEDKKIFNMDMNPKETNAEYMESCVHGGRQYLLHESPDTLPQARRQLFIMVRVQNKISVGLEVLQFFTMRQWTFKSTKYEEVWTKLGEEDKKIFNMDMDDDMPEDVYLINGMKGGRQYIMHEPLETLPKARRQMKIAYCVDRLCKAIFLYFVGNWLLRVTGIWAMLGY